MSTPLIRLDNITYRIASRNILHDITLELRPNEILTIVGPNGAGKSTLLSIILGHIKPSSGNIKRQNSLKMSYVPQRFHTPADLPMTVERFLKDLPNATQSTWFERLNIAHLIHKPLQSLSGGETQRLLLARALIRNQDVIILDEPAAGIDPASLNGFYQIIRDYHQQTHSSIIMVSHDIHLVTAASDKVICLNKHICCQGTPESINDHSDFRRLLGESNPENIAVYTHKHNHQHP